MLTPTHRCSRTQKFLIVIFGSFALLACATLIYSYERYHRGPGREILCGTWYGANVATEDSAYLQFSCDGTFSFGTRDEARLYPRWRGRWYAGGSKIYLSVVEGLDGGRPVIIHIVDVQPTELRVRFWEAEETYVYRRADATNASNQTMQRTALWRCDSTLMVATTFYPQPCALSPAVADLGSR